MRLRSLTAELRAWRRLDRLGNQCLIVDSQSLANRVEAAAILRLVADVIEMQPDSTEGGLTYPIKSGMPRSKKMCLSLGGAMELFLQIEPH